MYTLFLITLYIVKTLNRFGFIVQLECITFFVSTTCRHIWCIGVARLVSGKLAQTVGSCLSPLKDDQQTTNNQQPTTTRRDALSERPMFVLFWAVRWDIPLDSTRQWVLVFMVMSLCNVMTHVLGNYVTNYGSVSSNINCIYFQQ